MGVKISELTSAGTLAGTEKIPCVDSGTQYTTPADLKTYIAPLYAKLSDVKAANTVGGSATATTWTKRTLNTEDIDGGSIVSLASDAFTLQAGTYRVYIRSPYYRTDRAKTRLRNTTDGSTTLLGSSAFSGSGGGYASADSIIQGTFTIAGAKAFEVQYYVGTNTSTQDLGVESNAGVDEVFTVVEIWKEA